MSKPTANWEKVGDKFYRKVQLYQAVFDQDLELENYNVVGAPYSSWLMSGCMIWMTLFGRNSVSIAPPGAKK